MKFSLTDSLLERNDTLIKEIVRLRKKNNKLIHELKTLRRSAIQLVNTTSTCTQTYIHIPVSPLPRSPISREKRGRKSQTPTPTTPHSSSDKRVEEATFSTNQSQIGSKATPPLHLSKEDIIATPASGPKSGTGLRHSPETTVHLKFDNNDQLTLNFEDVSDVHVDTSAVDSTLTRRSSRRSSTGTPISYKEPSLRKKIRKGHQFFEAK